MRKLKILFKILQRSMENNATNPSYHAKAIYFLKALGRVNLDATLKMLGESNNFSHIHHFLVMVTIP